MKVKILPYDKEAPKIFDDFKKFLKGIIPYEIEIEIEHIGSTAVPGLGGKNVIDVMIITEKENHEKLFASGEYKYKGKERHMHIHITYQGSNEHVDKILFRDYLRNHPEEAKKYYELKKKWSIETENRQKYTELKIEYIRKILKKAKE